MIRLRLVALTILIGISTLSQAQPAVDNPIYRHIPADAQKVYHINFPGITGKVDWKALVTSFPAKEKNKQIAAFLSDPAQAGIDVTQGIFIAESNTLNIDSPRLTTILIPLTDSGKFIKFLKEQDNGTFVHLPGKPRMAREGTTTGLSWNATLVAVTFVKPPVKTKPAVLDTNHFGWVAARRSAAAIKGFDKSPFLTDPFFRNSIADDGDFHLYSRMNAGLSFVTSLMQMAHAPMDSNFLKASQQLKNNFARTMGTLRFENGRISYRSKVIYDSMGNMDFASRPLNTGLIEHLPQGNLLGMAVMHFNLGSYQDMMGKMQNGKSLHMLDSILALKGLSTKDVFSAFTGDLVLAVIDNGKTPDPATDSMGKPRLNKPDVYIVFPIGDMAAFTKISNVLKVLKDSTAQASTDTATKSPFGKWHPAHTIHDNIYVLGPNQQATDDYFNKPGRGPSRLVTDEVLASPFALVIDIKALTAYLQPVLSGSGKNQQALMILNMFDQITITSARIQGNTMESLVEVRLTDQQQNSLKTLLQLFQGH
ncbi:hypothetical protein [Puia dinghuensis]|uniref:DUF4836 family protein n=1 Tax=Puia dinghuensis TaxID=1792502 RepID=A0A8J2UI37_9BACT|nr:hypothetical protein [Puia dinghuensis]GGB19156.1 hypothetical protein GCM10011511_48610 [Puia dinghuensis]